jgi:dTDP-4-dehydrorhamnose 3,5-epimerase
MSPEIKNEFINKTSIPGLLIIERPFYPDERGSYQEKWRKVEIERIIGRKVSFEQGSLSESYPNVLRGIHAEPIDKVVTPLTGRMVAFIVDLRPESKTFGKYEKIEFDNTKPGRSRKTLFIPSGCGNSYCAYRLEGDEGNGIVLYDYAVSSTYDPNVVKRSVAWNDPDLAIKWPIKNPIISEKDRNNPTLRQVFPEKFKDR